MRSNFASMSAAPLKGSISSPREPGFSDNAIALMVKSRRRKSSIIVAGVTMGGFPVFSYRSVRAMLTSARTFPGRTSRSDFTSSSTLLIRTPARSRSFCNRRGFPCTVKSRSRIGNPLIMSRMAPPVRYTFMPAARATSWTSVTPFCWSGDSRISIV